MIQRRGKGALERLQQQADRSKKRKRMAQHASETLILVMDCSYSMASIQGEISKLHGAKIAAHRLVDRCNSTVTEIGLVPYSSDVVQSGLWPPSSSYADVHDLIDAMIARTGTHITFGLMSAHRMLNDVPIRRLIRRMILMTDGIDFDGMGDNGATSEQLRVRDEVIEHIAQDRIIVDCVAFGQDADLELLQRIASKTGGVVKEANDVDSLVRQFALLEAGARGLLTSGGR